MATSAELLVLIDAAIVARLAGRPVDQYSGDGMSVQYMTLEDLFKHRDRLRSEVAVGRRSRFTYADMSKRVT